MSIVAAADYHVSFRPESAPEDADSFWDNVVTFLNQDELYTVKKTKKGEHQVDIKPSIYDVSRVPNGIFLRLSAGSKENLKPDLVMLASCQALCGTDSWNTEHMFQVQRLELYAEDTGGFGRRFVKLEDLGEEIIEP
jgi:hypothetical protein